MMKKPLVALLLAVLACGCSSEADSEASSGGGLVTGGSGQFKLEAWADNWFSMSVGEQLILEDSVPITTERSFNAEAFSFDAEYPMNLNFVLKDFKQDDTGLEYIGTGKQQMGDGGFIAQITDSASGAVVMVSSAAWKCHVIHRAPLDKGCEKDADPDSTCEADIEGEPTGWKAESYDTSAWETATEYTEAAVGPKGGYDEVAWSPLAKLVWTSDLETDNTLLCKVTVPSP